MEILLIIITLIALCGLLAHGAYLHREEFPLIGPSSDGGLRTYTEYEYAEFTRRGGFATHYGASNDCAEDCIDLYQSRNDYYE